MVDTVATKTLLDGPRHVIVSCTSESDGTGETDAVKVDLSALSAFPDGRLANELIVDAIEYAVGGYNYVTLEYEHTTDVPIAVLRGSGTLTFPSGRPDGGSGTTGDIVLSTDGPADGASYTIVIVARKKYASN